MKYFSCIFIEDRANLKTYVDPTYELLITWCQANLGLIGRWKLHKIHNISRDWNECMIDLSMK